MTVNVRSAMHVLRMGRTNCGSGVTFARGKMSRVQKAARKKTQDPVHLCKQII